MSDETNYPEGITPELLMAYADGVLAGEDAKRVETALASRPDLVEEVDAYRRTSAAMRNAFDAPLSEPVPDHLAALVMGGAEESGTVTSLHAERQRRAAAFPAWGQAISACAVFAIGVVFGSAILGGGTSGPDSDILLAGRLDAAHPVAQALESTASAQTVDIPGGRFDAVATFPTASGDPCREFEASDATGAVVGIACRRSGTWTIELLLHAEPAGTTGGGFRLASGFDAGVIDTVLDGLGAGLGLSSDEEKCLIAADWNATACPEDGGAE